MKTSSINFNYPKSLKYHNRPTFKGAPIDIGLRNIKGNRCACCGHEMIPHDKITEVINNISEPLKKALTNDKMYIIKDYYPDIWKILLKFASDFPKMSFGKIISSDENYVPFIKTVERCLKVDDSFRMLSFNDRREKIKSLSEDIKVWTGARLQKSEVVMHKLAPFKKYLHGYKKDVFEELEYMSLKYPDRTLTEIIRDKDVYENYIIGTLSDITDIAKKRDFHIAKADRIILAKDKSVTEDLKKIHTQIYDHYRHISDPARFLYQVKGLYGELLKTKGLENLEKKVYTEIEQLPTCMFTKNTFLSHARRYYTDIDIINYVIKSFGETEEHIIPYSQGGIDSVDNKIALCRDCNVGRKSYPYTEYLKYHPEMVKNTLHQIDFISKRILDGTIPYELRSYPIKVAQTLTKYTDGAIKPDVTEYAKNIMELSSLKSNENSTEISELYSKRKGLAEESDSLRTKEIKLEFENKKEFEFRQMAQKYLNENA